MPSVFSIWAQDLILSLITGIIVLEEVDPRTEQNPKGANINPSRTKETSQFIVLFLLPATLFPSFNA